MDRLFRDETALLTGATSGIGAAIAAGLRQAGLGSIVISGRDEARGAAAAARIAGADTEADVRFVRGDATVPADVDRLVESTMLAFGRIDVFVHCVGSDVSAMPFVDLPREAYGRMVDGHFMSLLNVCGRVVPVMRQAQRGVILTLASDAAKTATPGETVIGALKAAVAMFTRTLALEVSRHGVRANCLTPSIVRDTITYDRLMAGGFSKRLFEKAQSRARLGVVSPADIAPLAVFLASPAASKITGQTISVNGGISAA